MSSPTIIDLIHNGTMSVEIAATLWAAVDARRSLIVVAVPRLAGKSTVENAVLALLPPEVPLHHMTGSAEQRAQLKAAAAGGYLVVPEFSQGPVPGYIWGQPVREIFDAMTAGYALATSLHAPGLQEAFDDICQANGVAYDDASRIGVVVYIRRFWDGPDSYRRRVAEVHEIDRVVHGRPLGRLLHRWLEHEDRFERVDLPRAFADDLSGRAARLSGQVESGRSGPEAVAAMAEEYRTTASR